MNGWETEAFIAQDNIRKRRHAKFIKLFVRNHFTMMSRIFWTVQVLKFFPSFTRTPNGLMIFSPTECQNRKSRNRKNGSLYPIFITLQPKTHKTKTAD